MKILIEMTLFTTENSCMVTDLKPLLILEDVRLLFNGNYGQGRMSHSLWFT